MRNRNNLPDAIALTVIAVIVVMALIAASNGQTAANDIARFPSLAPPPYPAPVFIRDPRITYE